MIRQYSLKRYSQLFGLFGQKFRNVLSLVTITRAVVTSINGR